MAGLTIDVSIEGLRSLQKMLATRDWYAKPWHDGMTTLASKAGLAAQKGAPVATGYLQSRIRTAVQKKPFPTWIAIRNQARRRRKGGGGGYPYPRLLAFSPKHHHRDWLIKAVQSIWKSDSTLNAIAKDIAREWGRR